MPSVSFKYPTLIAAGVATTGSTISSSAINLPSKSLTQKVTFYVGFTLGSLTNITFKPQVTSDGATWYDVLPAQAAITASGNYAFPVECAGGKQVRLSYLATGTATGSSVSVDCLTQQA